MPFHIKAAEPINNRLLIAISGPQASGKTTSALRLATGIVEATGGKICFIDTEKRRALKYAGSFAFNHMELDPPFSPARYEEALLFAEKSGYGEGDVVIIDSATHEHDGPGGVLELHEEYMKSKNYNPKFNMLGWGHAKKGRKMFIYSTLQRTPCHIILCFRAKQDLEERKVNGKTQYVKTGLGPVGADEYFYEMDISIVLPLGSQGKPSWDEKAARINEYGDGPIKALLHGTQQVSEETGKRLAELSVVTAKASEDAPEKAEETEEAKTKRLAGDIVKKLKACSESGDLQIVMEDSESSLAEIKELSQATCDYVINEYETKRVALGG